MMTFGFSGFVGLGIQVADAYVSDEDSNPKKCIWLLFHFPFFRIGFIL